MDFVRIQIRCRCGETFPGCIRISRNVPAPLRCTPAPGPRGASRSVVCPKGHLCFGDLEDLRRAVESLVSRGWGRWQREGAVVVEC
jgi:hypothetical protein